MAAIRCRLHSSAPGGHSWAARFTAIEGGGGEGALEPLFNSKSSGGMGPRDLVKYRCVGTGKAGGPI